MQLGSVGCRYCWHQEARHTRDRGAATKRHWRLKCCRIQNTIKGRRTMPSDHTSAFSLTRSGLLTSSGAMYGNVPLQAGDTFEMGQDRQAPEGHLSST